MTQTFNTGTLAGTGTFRCEACGFPIALLEQDQVPACPHCGEQRFRRASLFAEHAPAEPTPSPSGEEPDWLAEAREALIADGDYLAFEDDERVRVVALQEGFTRLGRSLAAHVRFDDPTVSRRHAVIHRDEGVTNVLDDRSLNGVFVNGERVDWRRLEDGDEIVMGRFRLFFISLTGTPDRGREGVGSAVG